MEYVLVFFIVLLIAHLRIIYLYHSLNSRVTGLEVSFDLQIYGSIIPPTNQATGLVVTTMNNSGIVDVAHRGMLYVRYDKTNRHDFLNQLLYWGYTIREHLWDESEYTFPIITVDPVNKIAFGAGVTVMACYCSSGGKEIAQPLALQWLEKYHAKETKTPS